MVDVVGIESLPVRTERYSENFQDVVTKKTNTPNKHSRRRNGDVLMRFHDVLMKTQLLQTAHSSQTATAIQM